jgi:hypothetical protein
MTREDQLREARHFLGLPHPADKDDVSNALQYIEFRNQAFRATKQRHSKPMKRKARSLLNALARAHKAGLPMPEDGPSYPSDKTSDLHLTRKSFVPNPSRSRVISSFLLWYHYIAATPSEKPRRADGFKQRLALQQAFWLLDDRDRPCVASGKGDWCKLAAILLGYPKPTAVLLSQARQLRVPFRLKKMKIPGVTKGRVTPIADVRRAVYAGQERLGAYGRAGDVWTAFDRRGNAIGVFDSEQAAIAAIRSGGEVMTASTARPIQNYKK